MANTVAKPAISGQMHASLLNLLTDTVDRMIENAADSYGGEPGVLFADAFDAKTGAHQEWRGFVPSNFHRQQNFLRMMLSLGVLTGNERYTRLARAWVDHALTVLVEPKSHLFYWGGHSCYDLKTKQPLAGNHELKFGFPFYSALHDVNPWAVERFIEGLWSKHVKQPRELLFNRHGFYTWWFGRTPTDINAGKPDITPWDWAYAKPALPIVQSDTRFCAFRNIAMDLVFAAAYQHHFTKDDRPLTWALRMLGQFDDMRHPKTGLTSAQYSHFEPCRARESLRGELGKRDDLNESTLLPRWAVQSYAWTAIGLLSLGDDIGAPAAPFRDFVEKDLVGLAEHIYDEASGCFLPGAYDGTRITPDDIDPGVGYMLPEEFEPIHADGMMFLAYAKAFRVTGRESFGEMAIKLAKAMKWGDAIDGDGPIDLSNHKGSISPFFEKLSPDGPPVNIGDACALVGCLEMHRATGSERYLQLATALGDRLIADYYADGFFHERRDEKRDGSVLLDDSVPWALTHLAAAQMGKASELPSFYAVNSYFDSKIVERQLD